MDNDERELLDAKIKKLAANADAVMAGRRPRMSLVRRLFRALKAPVVNSRELAEQTQLPEKLIASMQGYGSNIRPFPGADGLPTDIPAPGLVIDTLGQGWRRIVRSLRRKIGHGYLVFCMEHGFTQRPDQIAVIRGTDQFDALRAMKTSGPNYDIDHEQVLGRVAEWHRKYGLVLMGAGHDWLEAEFNHQPADMGTFAQEVYEFCPDVVDQGTESVERLASEMQRSNSVYLWWD